MHQAGNAIEPHIDLSARGGMVTKSRLMAPRSTSSR
jgi:hypothetical protein